MLEDIIDKLKSHANPSSVAGMARYGINPINTLGVQIPVLRKMAKEIGKNHGLAIKLWDTGIHEARILAGMIDDPKLVSSKQMDKWASGFDSWDVCDQVALNLFSLTDSAYGKCVKWSENNEVFIKRAGFSMMAVLAVKDKKAGDKIFEGFLPIIKKESVDERNFVKKAVNWALRQIGKRNIELNKKAIKTADEILKMDSKSSKWIARDALRELKSDEVQKRLSKKNLT